MSALRLARGFTRRDRIAQVRRLLPRPRRRAARERRLGARDARDPVDARACRPASPRTRSSCPYNDVDARRRRGRALRRGARGDHRRAGRREHGRRPAGAGFLEALRRLCDASRRAARLRRGDHRLPRRARRRAGALRRAPGPDDPRQDRRRRPAARGLRRPRGRDGAARAVRRRLPGGHAVGEPARDRGRALASCAGCATRPSTSELERAGRAPRGRTREAVADTVVQRVGAMLTLVLPRRAGADFDDAQALRHRALRRALPPPARARGLRGALAVRGAVRLARARRRRDRPHGRGRCGLRRT